MTARFVLQHQWWKGPKLVRAGPSIEQWNVIVNDGKSVRGFVLESSPAEYSQIAAHERSWPESWFAKSGQVFLPPGGPGNPTKGTPGYLEVMDNGEVVVFEWSAQFVKVEFKGSKLKGLWTVTKEDPHGGIWTMEKSSLPKEVKACMQSPFKFKRLGSGLMFTLEALKPGTYRGLDGNTIKYEKNVIMTDFPDFVGKPIKNSHEENFRTVRGFVRGATVTDEGIGVVEGITWDPETISRIESGEYNGASVEQLVQVNEDPMNPGLYLARSFKPEAIALCPNATAACKGCSMISTVPVALQDPEVVAEVAVVAVPEPVATTPEVVVAAEAIVSATSTSNGTVAMTQTVENVGNQTTVLTVGNCPATAGTTTDLSNSQVAEVTQEVVEKPIEAQLQTGEVAQATEPVVDQGPANLNNGTQNMEDTNVSAKEYPNPPPKVKKCMDETGKSYDECMKLAKMFEEPEGCQHAAQMTELEGKVKDLETKNNELAGSVTDLTKKLGEAATGKDEAVKMLEALQSEKVNGLLETVRKTIPDYQLPATLTTYETKMNFLNLMISELGKIEGARVKMQAPKAENTATKKNELLTGMFGAEGANLL